MLKNLDNAQITKPVSQKLWINDTRSSYIINNPFRYIYGFGLATPPTGLEQGQVGICFEAFIAASKLGPGGIGHGDGRSHHGNNRQLTARVTLWTIIETNIDKVSIVGKPVTELAPSIIGIDYKLFDGGTIDLGNANYRFDPSIGGTISFQGTATTDVKLSNIQSKIGEKDFGAGVDVTVSIANGTNGAQQLGRDLQNSYNPVNIALGKAIEAASPAGTIDGNATLRIKGKGGRGDVSWVRGETRLFPSYAVYAYAIGADGKSPEITYNRKRNETPPVENLTKPMIPW